MSSLIVNPSQAKVLAKLRAPSARRAYLRYGFAHEGYTNRGYTLRLDAGEPAVACGNGVVKSIAQKPATWPHSTGDLDYFFPFEVVIDHGQNIRSVVSGMQATPLAGGQIVARGDLLGYLATDECFVGVKVNDRWINPNDISRHFSVMTEQQIPGHGHKLRFGPDTLIRDLSNGLVGFVYNDIRYFQDTAKIDFLINIDFNGNGTKTGLAAVGFTAADHWNVYNAGSFTITTVGGYCYGNTFDRNPQLILLNQAGVKTSVRLERIASGAGSGGSASEFDPMLSTWIGANTGVPEENFFALKGLPAGNYELYLYANAGTVPNISTFYVAVGSGAPVSKSTNPTVTPAFIENSNYVKFALSVASGSYISVKVYGFIAGLQLIKV